MRNFQNNSITTMISHKSLLNDKIAKKLFKNEKYVKKLAALIISHLLEIDYDNVLNNITPISEEQPYQLLPFQVLLILSLKQINSILILKLIMEEKS